VRDLPLLKQGTRGQDVRTMQGLLVARGHNLAVDGDFGTETASALRAAQKAASLKPDGLCGQLTWPALLGVA
jgi:peptidoglycan hydrolase-like protein with peptidoglycan-binding domain